MSLTMTQEQLPVELCQLLQTLSLGGGPKRNHEGTSTVAVTLTKDTSLPPQINVQEDVAMFDDPNYQSDTAESDCSNTSTRSEHYGCAYLRTIQAQLESYPTTGGEYLEAIFTHREIFFSYPEAHIDCARGFSDIAHMLEHRAWRADREADTEAVAAFRHEAWTIAATMTRQTPEARSSSRSQVCIMQPAW